MRPRLPVFVILLLVMGRANADSICNPGEPQPDCIDRFAKAWVGIAQDKTMNANTGVANLVSPSQSTSKDFLSMLAAALIVPMNEDGSRPLAIDFNHPFPLFGEQRLKLQAVLAKPGLSGHLKKRLGSNAAALTEMTDSLSEFDDVTVSSTLEPSTRHFGRSITPYREAYEAMLKSFVDMQQSGDDRESVVKAADDFARPFAMLLSNQPQLFGSVLYRARKNIAGADERAARLTYEIGFHNLTSFYRAEGQCKDLTDANTAECAQKLVSFAGRNATPDAPADRIAMSVEYRSANAFAVALPQYAVHFNASPAHTLTYSLAYGRSGMLKNGRLDVAVNYEDTTVSEATDVSPPASGRIPTLDAAADPPKAVRDRLVASATYTYKFSDTMAFPLTLTYANHAAFLGDVDRKLSAHFGITFKMPR